MHPSAMKTGKNFFDVYAKGLDSGIVLDIGSQNCNGSLRDVCPTKLTYIGIDIVEGPGVDVVSKDPYSLPFPDNHADMIICSSCFEHSEMFWLLFLEIIRVLKPTGLFYLNVPSNGVFHRVPVDCWRFYPDSGKALITWAVYNKFDPCLLESFTCYQVQGHWNDYVAVFLKDKKFFSRYADRISDVREDIENIHDNRFSQIKKYQEHPQDWRGQNQIKAVFIQLIRLLWRKCRSFFTVASLKREKNVNPHP